MTGKEREGKEKTRERDGQRDMERNSQTQREKQTDSQTEAHHRGHSKLESGVTANHRGAMREHGGRGGGQNRQGKEPRRAGSRSRECGAVGHTHIHTLTHTRAK